MCVCVHACVCGCGTAVVRHRSSSHSTAIAGINLMYSCTAVCHVLLGYIVLELTTASLFLPFFCAVGYMVGIMIKVCALSLYILIV